MSWNRKDLLGLQDLSVEEITLILDTAESFKEVSDREVKKVPALRGKTVVNIFFEPSTRTRISFELAEKRLSADSVNIVASVSSMAKGETLIDTVKNIEALRADMIVIRHSLPGSPKIVAENVKASVVNAGDGAHEHPTQALLDLFTIREKKGRIKGLNVVIAGDIAHSRVARSNIWGLKKMGANVSIVGPSTMIPVHIEELGVKVFYDIKEAVKDADVVNVLRIQKERQSRNFFPSIREYSNLFGINKELLDKMKKDVIIMHPGPINRGIELFNDVADSKNSVILDQVTNGVAVRMAVMYLLVSRSGLQGA
ncbi:aspartate carbamoyltransferase catalytic subunit [bacterium]|nr:aspartate carbamoyltransferase catalytic subunit [bacterium]